MILLIDTSGVTGTIALAIDAPQPALLATATLPGRTASERLVPAIRSLLAQAGHPLQSLTAIAIVHGPGSFTGVRVGLSAAKGLTEALTLPLIAISRLAILAHLASAPAHVHAVLDAGRGELYFGHYLDGTCLREALLTRDQLLDLASSAPPHLTVACEPAIAESLAALSPRLLAEPTAADALPLAIHRLRQASFDDPILLDANYLRRTDAEIFATPKPKAAPTPTPTAIPPAQ